MLLLGLTGSIATGKSTVSNTLRAPPYNYPIIDADVIARQVVEPGQPAYEKIVKYFLPTTPDLLLPVDDEACGGLEMGKDGKGRPLNRPALGKRVFGMEPERVKDRNVLNGIVHPAVRGEMRRLMLKYFLTGHHIIILDIPLLFESGWERFCGTVLVVSVTDPSIQIQRLRARDTHLSEEDAQNRVSSQRDVREKARQALARGEGRGVVVLNDGDKEDLKREIARVMSEVERGSPRWWALLCLVVPPVGLMAAAWTVWRNWRAQVEWAEAMKREKAKL
ncbi:hypothetical protein BLS_003992 [Venturia inaequalis]|uniref:Dephospho-CoA kinase n=1 Tax=Venturia inaequalis TaxID=5025 RepID=A0A8H3VSS7_VENIN|nr:hypothetical protein EG328_011054 [Venturia inaequalis]KAE9983622.1 hypothetical protein BLS_003992 [Venturia inaequalis]KAE9992194.1 hypothetical protein EG327_009807 [Venturia inaequalis]RDI84951.1 hypothetical protein Vi05172_g5093 [Venturia inaequalis]